MPTFIQAAFVVLRLGFSCVLRVHSAKIYNSNCVFLTGDIFMCNTCTAKEVPVEPADKPHVYTHSLVRCHVQQEDDTERSTDERVITVETTVAALSNTIKGIKTQVAAIDSKLEGYMERIERMLGQLVTPEHRA